jgi:hypothetical protein
MRLPYCCRRHGAHHCAMDSADNGASGPGFNAPAHCPQFPGALPATVAPVFIGAAAPVQWSASASVIYSSFALLETARAGRLRSQLDRGPPSLTLA